MSCVSPLNDLAFSDFLIIFSHDLCVCVCACVRACVRACVCVCSFIKATSIRNTWLRVAYACIPDLEFIRFHDSDKEHAVENHC